MLAMVGAVLGSLAVTSVAMGQGVQPALQQTALRATTSQATVIARPAMARQPAQAARPTTAQRAAIAPQGQDQAALLTPVSLRAPLVFKRPAKATPCWSKWKSRGRKVSARAKSGVMKPTCAPPM
jgi:hypothetical protein